MTLIDQTPPEKDTTWMWVVGVVVVLCLCCGMVAAVAGGYYLVTQRGLGIPGLTVPTPTRAPAIAVPTGVPPTEVPAPLTVQPFDPNSGGQFQTLQNLVPNWQALTAPGVNNWQGQVSGSQPVVIFMGWCAIDQNTLTENYQHLTWTVSVDGKEVPSKSLVKNSYADPQQGSCQSYSGLINSWTAGVHTIIIIMHFDQATSDGWSTYPAGDYTDVYQITVTSGAQ
jgi:hypothetical protein